MKKRMMSSDKKNNTQAADKQIELYKSDSYDKLMMGKSDKAGRNSPSVSPGRLIIQGKVSGKDDPDLFDNYNSVNSAR